MAGKRTVDIKLAFEQFDMMPGATGKKFQRNLLLHGGSADTQGFSITDCFLRLDDYAVQNGQPTTLPAPAGTLAAPGAGIPAAPAGNAGQQAAAVAAQHAARKGRLKQSFTFLCSHVSDSSTLELLGDPLSPMFHNGPDAYDWIMQQVIKPPSTGDLQDMIIEFWLIEIITDVGITANSIADSIKMLRVVNAEFPLVRRFTDDQLSEKLLTMVEHGSKMFALEAKKELDAVEGVPGTPGVRQFQLAAPAAGGPRPRDLNGIILFWQGQWESAVKSKALPVAAATGQAGKARRRHQADGAHVATEQAFELAIAPATRGSSPSRTLGELTEAGFVLTRGTVTTSDWRLAGRTELARSATDGDGGQEFSVEVCFDADDTPSIEMLCDCCGGAGHKRLVCPSPKKFRSHTYMVALHTSAAKRKDDNTLTKYGANLGGRRPPPRGQKAPFKETPRRYSAKTPFRRFEPGTPRPTQGQLQAARELLERELLETEDVDAERAEAVTETKPAATDAARSTTLQHVVPAPLPAPSPLPSTEPSLLALQRREIAMPSAFSSDDFYSDSGFGATEVELPAPTTIDDLPTAVLARVIDLASCDKIPNLFVLSEVSHGFQRAVHEHVDNVYASEERKRKSDDDWPADSSDSSEEVDSESSELSPAHDTAMPRPRSLMPAAMALGAVALACIAMWFSTARLILAKLGEAFSGATPALPAGIVTVLIVLLLSTRAGAVGLPYDRAAIAHRTPTVDGPSTVCREMHPPGRARTRHRRWPCKCGHLSDVLGQRLHVLLHPI